MKDAKYFWKHAMMAVEIEHEFGGRSWKEMPAKEVNSFCENIRNCGISDIDYSCKQPNEWCRKVLNTADYNWRNNRKWCKDNNFKSFQDVIDWILKNKRV